MGSISCADPGANGTTIDRVEIPLPRILFDGIRVFLIVPHRLKRLSHLAAVNARKQPPTETQLTVARFASLTSRGRDTGYPVPPAQIRTCGTTASDSCLRSYAQAFFRMRMNNTGLRKPPL